MLVEDFIMTNELIDLNKQGQPYAFSTPIEENNIDLSVASGSIMPRPIL